VLSFEAGSKNRLFDNALQLNVTAFHYRYNDYQASQLGCLNLPANLPACTASGRITYNADKATVYGLELESVWAITSADRLGVVGALTHSEFDDFVLPVTPYSSGGDFSGNPLPKSPKSTLTVDYSHRFDLANGGIDHGRGPGPLRRQAVPAVRHPQPDHPPGRLHDRRSERDLRRRRAGSGR
jgi:iron complex outermembrane receptor protein